MKQPVDGQRDYTDGRPLWDWQSKYPKEARRQINIEAGALIAMLAVCLVCAGVSLGLADQSLGIPIGDLKLWVNFRFFTMFFTGSVGAVTFSIKWLIHATAKGKWHLERRYWRLMVPCIGGVYACVVLTLFNSGMLPHQSTETSSIGGVAALSFMVGYFSDGVSGLLSNIANAVFGTLEKK